MDSLNKLVKSVRSISKMDNNTLQMYTSYIIFGATVLYIFYCGQIATIGLAVGVAMMTYAVIGDCSVALLAGALIGLVAISYTRPAKEGFVTEDEAEQKRLEASGEGSDNFQNEDEEPKKIAKPKKASAKKAPNNGERAEFFELGKKYKIPSEEDDKEFHLDAGTTFLNAYKSLKPDQIAEMTKDTQDLMQTQKQLMSTLQTLKPLITDGKQMMDMFQTYFGSGNAGGN